MNTQNKKTDIVALSAVVATVIRKIESPPISKRAKDKKSKMSPLLNKHLENSYKLVINENNHTGTAFRKLSEHEKEDVAQIVASVLSGYTGKIDKLTNKPICNDSLFLSTGTLEKRNDKKSVHAYCKILDKERWLLCFSQARKQLRMDRKFERPNFEFRLDDANDKLPDNLLENSMSKHYEYDKAKRDGIAKQAKLFRLALKEAFLVDTSRKRKSVYHNAKFHLISAVKVMNNNGAHGMDEMKKSTRAERKKSFHEYIASGLKSLSEKGKLKSFEMLELFKA
jgi:hypothetical protein